MALSDLLFDSFPELNTSTLFTLKNGEILRSLPNPIGGDEIWQNGKLLFQTRENIQGGRDVLARISHQTFDQAEIRQDSA